MGKHSKKSKKHKRRKSSSSSSSSSAGEWVEKASNDEASTSKRDEWMSLSTTFTSESHLDRKQQREETKRVEKERVKYNPRESVRELNPYWKDSGDGLPKFQKPSETNQNKYESSNRYKPSSSWRKRTESPINDSKEEEIEILSDKELNVLAAKLVKAEIMGKTDLIKELKIKLENARRQTKDTTEHVLLTETDSSGLSRPVKLHAHYQNPWENQKKKRKVETHTGGERVRYFPDDDKQSLQEMFENEKFNSAYSQNEEFLKLSGRVGKNDDLDDIFTDKIRNEESSSKTNQKRKDRAINQHQRITKSIDNCKFCLQSEVIAKHLMVSLSDSAFLSLPSFEPLCDDHCLITPIRHVSCSTLLDENEWDDIMNFRKALTRLFQAKNQDCIFFENARNLEKHPHMFIECVPINKEEGDLAPIYFKKAIDECEREWSQNKKLISLKGKNVRKAVPKGLPYFFVSFGLEEGYAHVIEDEKYFPQNFAQEIIGGMLDLDHTKWRKPKKQNFNEQSQRIVEFSKSWKDFDFIQN